MVSGKSSRRFAALMCVLLGLGSVSCSLFRGGKGAPVAEPAASTGDASVDAAAGDREAKLRKLVKAHIERETRAADVHRDTVARRKPYFSKEYCTYPDGPEGFALLIQEQEGRSVPCIADVTMAKVRFATRYHRKRVAAEGDTNFLRDTGTETITYELRNGRWTRVGSLFVAEKTEENVNGEWAPVEETVKRTVAAEEPQPGWLSRTWSKITGR